MCWLQLLSLQLYNQTHETPHKRGAVVRVEARREGADRQGRGAKFEVPFYSQIFLVPPFVDSITSTQTPVSA